MANYVTASCGHPVVAVGAPNSPARYVAETSMCRKCEESLVDSLNRPSESVSTAVGHTPGPWEVCGSLIAQPIKGTDKARAVATVLHCYPIKGKGTPRDYDRAPPEGWNGEADANARLIAAAPDLLAALKECVTDDANGVMNTGQKARRLAAIDAIARAAIEKAAR